MRGQSEHETRQATKPRRNTGEYFCITCQEKSVQSKNEECMDCYKKELYAFASLKFGRDIKPTGGFQVIKAKTESY